MDMLEDDGCTITTVRKCTKCGDTLGSVAHIIEGKVFCGVCGRRYYSGSWEPDDAFYDSIREIVRDEVYNALRNVGIGEGK